MSRSGSVPVSGEGDSAKLISRNRHLSTPISTKQDFKPRIQQRVVELIVAVSPPVIEKFSGNLPRPGRPNPNVGFEKQPAPSTHNIDRYAQRLSPKHLFRMRVLIVDRCEQSSNLACSLAHRLAQSLKRNLIAAVRVCDEVGAAPSRAGQKWPTTRKGVTECLFQKSLDV